MSNGAGAESPGRAYTAQQAMLICKYLPGSQRAPEEENKNPEWTTLRAKKTEGRKGKP